MKIIQIGGTFVGAQKKIESSIHNFLQTTGHESKILYAIGESDDKNIICYENRFLNLIRRFLRKYIGKNPHFSLLSTLNIIRYIEEYKPDVVNFHVMHNGYMDYVILLKYLANKKIPVVFTAHDMWFMTGGCYHYADIGCEEFKKGCLNCPKHKKELDCSQRKTGKYFLQKKRLFEKLHRISFISVSAWVHAEISRSHLNRYQNYLVWNALDDMEPLAVVPAFDLPNGKFKIIGVAGSWTESKGINRFFELASLLGDDFEITLVGGINNAWKAFAPNNMRFAGSISNSTELQKLYASSDLHVSMSLEETFGMTFVESAFAGIRSMGFNCTAIPGVLKKVHGYIIPAADVAAAAEQIRLLSNNRINCRLSETEYTEIVKIFSANGMAKEYAEIYEKQLSML